MYSKFQITEQELEKIIHQQLLDENIIQSVPYLSISTIAQFRQLQICWLEMHGKPCITSFRL